MIDDGFPQLPTCRDCSFREHGTGLCRKARTLREVHGLTVPDSYHPTPDVGVRCPEFGAKPGRRAAA